MWAVTYIQDGQKKTFGEYWNEHQAHEAFSAAKFDYGLQDLDIEKR